MPFCKSGKHYWTDLEDAQKCCNGYVRRLVIPKSPYDLLDCDRVVVNDIKPYGYKWVKVKERKTMKRQTLQLNKMCISCPIFRDNACQGWARVSTPICEMTGYHAPTTRGLKGGAKHIRKQKPAVKRSASKAKRN